MDNENRRDIVYDAQCAVINKVCLNDKFDIYEMTEFDTNAPRILNATTISVLPR